MKCPYYKNCSCPLCPEDEDSLVNGIWYPDEETCKRREYAQKTWIKNQRKIKRRAKDTDKYFTLEILKRQCTIKGGIGGIDPDKPTKPQIEAWLEAHKTKRQLSETEKQVLRDRMKRLRQATNTPKTR